MDIGEGMCYAECCEMCKPGDSQTCTPGTNNTLYVNQKKFKKNWVCSQDKLTGSKWGEGRSLAITTSRSKDLCFL